MYIKDHKCYPTDAIENENNIAKILKGDIEYDITNVQVKYNKNKRYSK